MFELIPIKIGFFMNFKKSIYCTIIVLAHGACCFTHLASFCGKPGLHVKQCAHNHNYNGNTYVLFLYAIDLVSVGMEDQIAGCATFMKLSR